MEPTQAEHRRRSFINTVWITVAIWVAYWVMLRLLYFAIQGVTFSHTSFLTDLLGGFDAASAGLELAIALQVAIWWLWREPNESRPLTLACLCFLFAIPVLLQILTSSLLALWVAPNPHFPVGPLPKLMWAIWLIDSALIVPWCLVTLSLFSPLLHFRLIDRQASDDASASPSAWTIKGLLLVTFLIAVGIVLRQASSRILESHFLNTTVNFESGNDFLLLIMKPISLAIMFFVMAAAAWFTMNVQASCAKTKRPRKILVATILSLAVVVAVGVELGRLVFTGTGLDEYFWWSATFRPMVVRHLFELATIYGASLWFFRRWQQAGFRIDGWLIGWGQLS
ncbi:hypothetical protein CA13_32030 [Planctomycetes bacterium CA13]|uniref:Uncharacterized protein n=1 Tax=Novipirellula herctigrandis TaxID=2527986 RepID=A0A5C5Z3H9_9BACT|nr:hypothetical protein CA13_32030 [Planctomycetes bacterium CA13]